jgi:GLPGLI family protein
MIRMLPPVVLTALSEWERYFEGFHKLTRKTNANRKLNSTPLRVQLIFFGSKNVNCIFKNKKQMKKTILLFAMTIVTSVMSFAQRSEGMVSYSVEMSSADSEASAMVEMFGESSMNLYFADNVVRTELSFGFLLSMTTIVNNTTDEVLILTGGMMGDKAVLTNSAEMNVEEEDKTESTVTLSKNKKRILGYKCKKAIVTDQDGQAMEYWYTKKIPSITTEKNSAISKLPGLPLEYSSYQDGMTMVFTATEVRKSLDPETKTEKLSFAIPEGYEEMTYEEFTSEEGM